MHYIYILQNKLNLKIYVGQSHDPNKRYQEHLYVASGNTTTNKFLIHRAMSKHGPQNFSFQILEEFATESEALDAEKFWIEFFRSDVNRFGNKFGYNLTAGGDGVLGRPHSQEAKNKISKAHTGKTLTQDTKNKMSISHTGLPSNMLGHKQTDKQKTMQSEMVSGNKNYFYGKHLYGEQNGFSVLTEPQVIEIIELLKNKTHKQTIIAKMYGVTLSTINKIKTKRSWIHLPR